MYTRSCTPYDIVSIGSHALLPLSRCGDLDELAVDLLAPCEKRKDLSKNKSLFLVNIISRGSRAISFRYFGGTQLDA